MCKLRSSYRFMAISALFLRGGLSQVSLELIQDSVRTFCSDWSALEYFPSCVNTLRIAMAPATCACLGPAHPTHPQPQVHSWVHPQRQKDPLQISEFLFCLDPSYSALYSIHSSFLSFPKLQSLSLQLNGTAVLCWGPLPALGSSKCLQAKSQIDYGAGVICLASLRD